MIILPTLTCFDDALDILEDFARAGMKAVGLNQYDVVHGICLAPSNDEPFAHAWVEHRPTAQVLQRGIIDEVVTLYQQPVVVFYLNYRPQKFTRYTVAEAIKLNHETNHYGPWVPEYVALCAEEKRRKR